jgi:hypothetical protein
MDLYLKGGRAHTVGSHIVAEFILFYFSIYVDGALIYT